MLRRLYDWVMARAASRHAPKSLFAVAFAESSFFPIPPDVMLAPMVLANPDKAWRYAALCTLGSVLGGILGYAIGFYLTPFGQWLMAITGHAGGLTQFKCWYDQYGVWVILAKGLTPIPYKLVTIASGLAAFSFPIFMAASVATRGARFFLVALVVKKFGPAMLPVIEKRLALCAGVLIALLVIGLTASHFLGGGSGGACAA
ncbi:MAG: putative rane protein [Caulobacter sp.]|nr:putative rane protein [Caulobacter sp.]